MPCRGDVGVGNFKGVGVGGRIKGWQAGTSIRGQSFQICPSWPAGPVEERCGCGRSDKNWRQEATMCQPPSPIMPQQLFFVFLLNKKKPCASNKPPLCHKKNKKWRQEGSIRQPPSPIMPQQFFLLNKKNHVPAANHHYASTTVRPN